MEGRGQWPAVLTGTGTVHRGTWWGGHIHGSVIAFVGGRGDLLLFLGLRLFLSHVRSSDEDVGFERLLFCSVA